MEVNSIFFRGNCSKFFIKDKTHMYLHLTLYSWYQLPQQINSDWHYRFLLKVILHIVSKWDFIRVVFPVAVQANLLIVHGWFWMLQTAVPFCKWVFLWKFFMQHKPAMGSCIVVPHLGGVCSHENDPEIGRNILTQRTI